MISQLQLLYHQSTIGLIGIRPRYSAEAVSLLKALEQTYDIVLPEAIEEWFFIDRIVETLQLYSDGHRPVSLEHLDHTQFVWHPTEAGDLLKQGWLIFMCESQGCCLWAAHLSGDPDPPVFIADNSHVPPLSWKFVSPHFSSFIGHWVWEGSAYVNTTNEIDPYI